MKILYLTPYGFDYLPDQLYTGLCIILGKDSVIDYPWKREYHDPLFKNPSIPQNFARPFEFEEVCALIEQRKIDLVVLTAQRRGTIEALESFSEKFSLPPLVLVDSNDSMEMQKGLFERFNPGVYFKREYHGKDQAGLRSSLKRWQQFGSDHELFQRTYPLTMSAILETIPPVTHDSEDVDISFNGYVSHRKRIRAVQLLKASPDIRFEGGLYGDSKTRKSKMSSRVSEILLAKLQGDPYVDEAAWQPKLGFEEHGQLLGRSKMGLSIRGSGFDTVRYWEIVASKTLLISERPSIYIPNNFEHEQHAIFCRPDLSDLVDLVKRYVSDDSERNRIADAGYAHLLKYHTCDQRALQFLEICKNTL
jgi:hypothetical protein